MTLSLPPVIVWFRQDLRLADNPAILAAAATGKPILALYCLDDEAAGDWAMGRASRWWLYHSLSRLEDALIGKGGQLVFKRGAAQTVLTDLISETGADAVYWNRCYEPWARQRDEQIKIMVKNRDLQVRSFNGSLIVEPWDIVTATGAPYRVFTPFWRRLHAQYAPQPPLPAPGTLSFASRVSSDTLKDWALTPVQPDWSGGLQQMWSPGESGAMKRLEKFLARTVTLYKDRRHLPGETGTSHLSPHLHFGEISPRQVWHAVEQAGQTHTAGGHTFLSEIAWREFSYNLLYHYPDLPTTNFQPRFDHFKWDNDDDLFTAWRHGRTGYPIVDAGMRELWATGWMHNRVRMIVASFLTKDMMIDWRKGQAWFWDTLVDADLANNAASWQWVAGSGADAAPYFRVFNPVLQGKKFDPDGAYVRAWLPELAGLPTKVIHAPWLANHKTLFDANVVPGETYPDPIVDHSFARKRALAAFESIKGGS